VTESGLPGWEWKRRYESPPDNLIDAFYKPSFARSLRYDRAVGFFSSSLLAQIAPSIDDFVLRGGRMRLITSPANLSDADLLAMGKGEALRERLREDLAAAAAAVVPSPILRDRLSLLTWMIEHGRLDVRIALREHPDHYSLFHEKIGVFTDADANWMTFTGSPNETTAAMREHSESFPLHRSWLSEDQRGYAEDERRRFNDLWDDAIAGIRFWSANEWIKEPLRRAVGMREPAPRIDRPRPAETPDDIPVNRLSLLPALPDGLQLRDYQKDAVNAWLTGRGRGTFAMATGTGKTITALTAATQIAGLAEETNRPLLVLVVVPLVDLVHQWKRDAEWFGWRPALAHGDIDAAEKTYLRTVLAAARSSVGRRAEMVIATAGSLTPREMDTDHLLQRQLQQHPGLLLVVGDEMHSLGTSARLAALPAHATFRLGLSATPKRHGDEEGTTALLDYFGPPVVSIGIKQAIYDYGALVEYDYHPLRIDLADDELAEYRVLSRRIAAAFARPDKRGLEDLVRRRNRIVQHASGKLTRLRTLMTGGLAKSSRQIIYVAEGKDPSTELNQLAAVEEILTDEYGMRVARYYGETEAEERIHLQRRLAEGELDALIAMKCLDEGVDIPSARVGVMMASTQNPRQFVQRRGRLLRKDLASGKTHAEIYDFVVLPPPDPESTSESEKNLVGAELGRAVELADAARNSEVRYDLIEWAYEYGLDPDRYTWMNLEGGDEMEVWTG
jgi:superfamily II DNA or RNA helicase